MPFGEFIFSGKKKRMQKITKLSAMALLGISLMSLNAKPVHASTKHVLNETVTKVNGAKNYRIYQSIDKKGPHKAIGNTKDFRYAHLESKEYAKTAKGVYWNLIINGRSVGWVKQTYFTRNKIALAKSVDLVQNDTDSFNPKDAISYIADSTGSAINPKKAETSVKSIDTSVGGEKTVEYSYKKAKGKLKVVVRADDDQEGIAEADADAVSAPKAGTTWRGKSQGSSDNWNKEAGYLPEEKKNHYVSEDNTKTLDTVMYQPHLLSLDEGFNDSISQVGVIPEGIAVKNGNFTVSMLNKAGNEYGHLVSYDLNKIKSPYDAQKLATMPYKQFVEYSRAIRVSPYIKLGHGQSVSDSGKYVYVLTNSNKLKNSDKSDEILQINRNDLTIKRIWTFKVYNGDSSFPRYFHNLAVVNDHLMYGIFHNASKGIYEYWKIEKDDGAWIPTEIGATDSELVKDAPVQGFSYDKQNDQFAVGFNDYIFKIAPNGKVLESNHFSTMRELEGLSFDNGELYAELTKRPELLKLNQITPCTFCNKKDSKQFT